MLDRTLLEVTLGTRPLGLQKPLPWGWVTADSATAGLSCCEQEAQGRKGKGLFRGQQGRCRLRTKLSIESSGKSEDQEYTGGGEFPEKTVPRKEETEDRFSLF